MLSSALVLLSLWSTPSVACSKIVFPFAAYGSPLIVEGTVRSIEGGVAEIAVLDTLKKPSPLPSLPLRVLISEVGYGASCAPMLGAPSLAVGDQAFLMLVPNELSGDAPWRPHGDWAEGIRLIRGEQVLAGGSGRWADDGSKEAFHASVAAGPHALQQQAQEERARTEQAACESGDAEACRLRARTLGHTEPEAATALLGRGCSLDDAESCLQYGLVLLGETVHDHYSSEPAQAADVAHHVSAGCAAGDDALCRIKERALRAAERAAKL